MENWIALAAFLVAGLVTPGPNTMMVFASGAAFGYRGTLNHMLGIAAGTILLFLAVGAGLNTLLVLYPALALGLKIVGLCYLLYLAIRIALSNPLDPDGSTRPISFFEAILIQALNVKLIGIAAGVAVNFILFEDPFWNVIAIALTAGLLNFPCASVWTLFGATLKRMPLQPRGLRALNISLFLIMLASLIPVAAAILSDIGLVSG